MWHIDKKKLWIFLRMGAIVCLIMSLFNIEIKRKDNQNCTIFLVDRSLSTEDYEDKLQSYVNSQIETKNSKDLYGVISFGENAMVDIPATKKIEELNFNTNIDSNFTNIENGIELALDSFPQRANKRLIVLTDGIENVGDFKKTYERVKDENVNFFVLPINIKKDNDVQLKSIKIPSVIYSDENIPVQVDICSNFDTIGTLHLYGDNDKIFEQKVDINKGLNKLEYYISLGGKDYERLRGEIEVDKDTNPHNNFITTEIKTIDNPKVIVIGQKEDRLNIEKLLHSLDVETKSYTPKETPSSLKSLVCFNEIILVNVSHDDLSEELEKNINYCTKEEGIGLLVVGGDNTFSVGNYKDTLLEGMLPVESHIKGHEKKPNAGIVLVIDSSGSMDDESEGIKKIEMAKEAAISSVEILDEDDYIGVIGFSDTLEWIVPYGQAKNKENIKNNIGKLKAKGGTLILPSLEESLNTLENSDAKINHIILMTDGEGEKEGYENILKKLKEKDITLSTIAVGKDSDKKFLEYLSDECKGRNYFVEDIDNIPKIFAKETYIATRKYINEREFVPQVAVQNSILKTTSFPKLKGYVGTSLKEGSCMILKTDLDEPLLATWQYGLGKVAVWTSDLNGKWSKEWINWAKFQENLKRIIDYLLVERESEKDIIEIVQKGTQVEISVDTNISGKKVEISVLDPDKKEKRYNIKQIRQGIFKDKIILDKVGSYIVNIQVEREGEDLSKYIRTINLDYSPEYNLVEENCNLEFLSKFDLVDRNTKVFDLPMKSRNCSNINLDRIFLPLAFFLFVSDLWIRKRTGRFDR